MLEQLQAKGLLSLPAVRKTAPSRPRRIEVTAESDAQSPLNGTAGDYLPLLLQRVDNSELSSLWNQFVELTSCVFVMPPASGARNPATA
jgi:hypothetical protein